MKQEVKKPLLPRVLVNARRGYGLEVLRGHKFSHVINADSGTISYDRVALEKLNKEWKEFSADSAQVRHFCDVCLNSYRPKTERVSRTLREIRSMTIDVQKATTEELVEFWNSKQTDEKKKVKKFADRKTAEERVTKLIASLAPAGTGTDADKPLEPEPTAVKTEASSNDTKGNDMSRTATTTRSKASVNREITKGALDALKKSDKKKAAAKEKAKSAGTKRKAAAAPKKKAAGSIAEGVKKSWGDKKVAAARATKHHVKVGGVVYRSCAEAFQKLKLDFSKCVKFRRELKTSANGRATFDGKTFTLVEIE
jgi:hypothetical protein